MHARSLRQAVEKAAERRTWAKVPDLLGHIFGTCPHAHTLAYCLVMLVFGVMLKWLPIIGSRGNTSSVPSI